MEMGTMHATVAVTDLDRAKKFYGETLGLSAKEERSDGVIYESGETWMLVYPSSFAGTNQATCMTFEVSDVEKAVEELAGSGERCAVTRAEHRPADRRRRSDPTAGWVLAGGRGDLPRARHHFSR